LSDGPLVTLRGDLAVISLAGAVLAFCGSEFSTC